MQNHISRRALAAGLALAPVAGLPALAGAVTSRRSCVRRARTAQGSSWRAFEATLCQSCTDKRARRGRKAGSHGKQDESALTRRAAIDRRKSLDEFARRRFRPRRKAGRAMQRDTSILIRLRPRARTARRRLAHSPRHCCNRRIAPADFFEGEA